MRHRARHLRLLRRRRQRTGRIVILFRPPPHGDQREAEPANIFAIRLSKDAGTSTSTFTTTLVTTSHSSINTDIESHAFTNAAIDDTNCELAARSALLPFVAILLVGSRSPFTPPVAPAPYVEMPSLLPPSLLQTPPPRSGKSRAIPDTPASRAELARQMTAFQHFIVKAAQHALDVWWARSRASTLLVARSEAGAHFLPLQRGWRRLRRYPEEERQHEQAILQHAEHLWAADVSHAARSMHRALRELRNESLAAKRRSKSEAAVHVRWAIMRALEALSLWSAATAWSLRIYFALQDLSQRRRAYAWTRWREELKDDATRWNRPLPRAMTLRIAACILPLRVAAISWHLFAQAERKLNSRADTSYRSLALRRGVASWREVWRYAKRRALQSTNAHRRRSSGPLAAWERLCTAGGSPSRALSVMLKALRRRRSIRARAGCESGAPVYLLRVMCGRARRRPYRRERQRN